MVAGHKIEIREWNVVDIYYNDDNEKEADKIRKKYEKKGYEYQQTDYGSPGYNNCIQMITRTQIIKK